MPARLSVALPPSQRPAFLKNVINDFREMTEPVMRADAAKSKAGLQSDEDAIREAVKQGVGFETLNVEIKNHLRGWYLDTVRELAEEESSKKDRNVDLLHNLAASLRQYGDYATALRLLEEEASRAKSGEQRERADLYGQIGLVLADKGEYDKALQMHEKALQIKLATLGEQHPDTAITYNNMGYIYDKKGGALEFVVRGTRVSNQRDELVAELRAVTVIRNPVGA